jgi:hypothetical protein
MHEAGMLERGLPHPAVAPHPNQISGPLCQMKECSAFKHKYTLYEVLVSGLQSFTATKFPLYCHLRTNDVPHQIGGRQCIPNPEAG